MHYAIDHEQQLVGVVRHLVERLLCSAFISPTQPFLTSLA
jgi:hypothetical protein